MTVPNITSSSSDQLKPSRSCSDLREEVERIICKVCTEVFITARDYNRHDCGRKFKPIVPSPSPVSVRSCSTDDIGCLEFLKGKTGRVVLTVPASSALREA